MLDLSCAREAPELGAALDIDNRERWLDATLIAHHLGHIPAEDAWNLLTADDLWPEAGPLLEFLLLGRQITRTREQLQSVPPSVSAPLLAFLRGAEDAGLLPTDARLTLEHLFPPLPPMQDEAADGSA